LARFAGWARRTGCRRKYFSRREIPAGHWPTRAAKSWASILWSRAAWRSPFPATQCAIFFRQFRATAASASQFIRRSSRAPFLVPKLSALSFSKSNRKARRAGHLFCPAIFCWAVKNSGLPRPKIWRARFDDLAGSLDDTPVDAILVDTTGQPFESFLDSVMASGLASDFTVILMVEPASLAASSTALGAGVRAVLPNDISADQLVAALE